MSNGPKNGRELNIQLPETKVAVDSGPLSSPLVSQKSDRRNAPHRKADAMHGAVRLLCLLTSVTAVSVMVTAKQASTISLYGFSIPIYSKWSFSDSFEYLVGVSAAVAVYSLVLLLICVLKVLHASPIYPSRNYAWLIFAGDQYLFKRRKAGQSLPRRQVSQEKSPSRFEGPGQREENSSLCSAWNTIMKLKIFAYAMMSAGSAASGVTNLNRTGIHHSALPSFCKPLRVFCDRIAVSIASVFFSFFLLATSVVLDVLWLSKN